MIKFISSALVAISCTLVFLLSSCNDPLQIGTELVQEEEVDFFVTDTVSIEAYTVQLDSAIAYQFGIVSIDLQHLGWVSDPLFGGHRSSLVFQLVPEDTSPPRGIIDSVKLTCHIYDAENYGIPNTPFNFTVRELSESLNNQAIYFADQSFSTTRILGSNTNYIRPSTDSVMVIELDDNGELDTLEAPALLSIPLNNSFAEELFELDANLYAFNDSFLMQGPTLTIQPESQNGAFLPLSTLLTSRDGNFNKISVFFEDRETGGPRQYDYFIGGATFTTHEHDYSMGTLEGIIDDPSAGENILAMQAGQGPTVAIKFPFLDELSDLVINEAVLEIVTQELPDDNRELYPLPSQLYTAHEDEVEGNIPTDEVILSNTPTFGIDLFGGQPLDDSSTGTDRIIYRFNIPDHLQQMINGEVSNELLIRSPFNASGINRAVFFGTNEGTNSVRLILTYSEI